MKKINFKYFFNNYTIEEKRKLFKQMVRLVEVEVHSHCNRTCWFCPNSYIDRKSNTQYFDEELYIRLLTDLSIINYDKIVSFTRYSEPFSDNIIFERLKQCKDILPNCVPSINTNSDYLSNEVLRKATDSGLEKLNIQIYLKEKDSFTKNNINKYANKIMKRISDVEFNCTTEEDDYIVYTGLYNDLEIKMYARDFKVNGTVRGDILVPELIEKRTSPCTYVFHDVVIDYNGTVVPCCNIRSDNEKQKNYYFGKLTKNNSIFDIFFNKNAIAWRKNLFTFSKKSGPCETCSFGNIESTVENITEVARINKDVEIQPNLEKKNQAIFSMKKKLQEKNQALDILRRKMND